MAENTTLARPYAQAVFKHARERNDLKGWSERLEVAASLIRDPTLRALIDSPRVPREQLYNLICEVGGEALADQEARNLIRLLMDNRRLHLMPDIAKLYELYRADAESTIEAELVSAYAVSDEQRDTIVQALKRRLNRDVVIHCRQDESLLGGAVIRAGDLVIDGSARGRLERLAGALQH